MRRLILFIAGALLFATSITTAQTGGNNTYAFLDLVGSARVAALGGNLISVRDNDVNLGFYNPALLNKSQDLDLAMNYVNYFAGINYGHISAGKHYDSVGTFAASIQYINYGKFQNTTATGDVIGEFSAGEYALQLGGSRALDSMWSIGANARLLYSGFETYNSFGASIDLAASYNNTKRLYSAGFLLRHLGVQFDAFNRGNREKLPFEIQAAITKRFKYAPLRMTLAAENLQKWNLRYEDPDPQPQIDLLTGDTIIDNKTYFADKLMRHLVFNTELLLTDNFNIRFGYNYRRRQELKIAAKPGMVGFSWGFAMKIKKFRLAYGRSIFSLAGASNHLSVSVHLADFRSGN